MMLLGAHCHDDINFDFLFGLPLRAYIAERSHLGGPRPQVEKLLIDCVVD